MYFLSLPTPSPLFRLKLPPHTTGAAVGAAPQALAGTVHFVLGNEACDLDSLVSALVLAYALSTSSAAVCVAECRLKGALCVWQPLRVPASQSFRDGRFMVAVRYVCRACVCRAL